MAGKDCSERVACEIVKIFSGLKSNSKALRILEIILPHNYAHQISNIRKAAGKRGRCSYVSCKAKKTKPPGKNPIKTYKLKPYNDNNKNKKTPHDLWMMHFEKKKPPIKQQQEKKPQPNRHNNNQQKKKQQHIKPTTWEIKKESMEIDDDYQEIS